MKLNPTAIPQGTRTYLFEEAATKRLLEQTVHSLFRSRGYQEIVTPAIEYHEAATIGLTEAERNRILRFTEGDSGRILSLRADITGQVARSAATHLAGRPLPLRLCYTGAVFRRTRKGHGEQWAINQSGIEIVGHKGPEADLEVLLSIKAAMEAAGQKNFSLSLSHAGFIGAFLQPFSDDECADIKRALRKKDKVALEELLQGHGADAMRVASLPELYGGGEVITKARELAKSGEALAALENLETIYNGLCDAGMKEQVSLDLGEMRGFGYYTGINMELFSESGIPLGTGGRYDNLVKRFGPDLPAVGFAFDVDSLLDAVMQTGSKREWHGADVLLLNGDEETAQKLRGSGLMALCPLEKMDEENAKTFARTMGIPHILVGGSDPAVFTAINVETGERTETGADEFTKNRLLNNK